VASPLSPELELLPPSWIVATVVHVLMKQGMQKMVLQW